MRIGIIPVRALYTCLVFISLFPYSESCSSVSTTRFTVLLILLTSTLLILEKSTIAGTTEDIDIIASDEIFLSLISEDRMSTLSANDLIVIFKSLVPIFDIPLRLFNTGTTLVILFDKLSVSIFLLEFFSKISNASTIDLIVRFIDLTETPSILLKSVMTGSMPVIESETFLMSILALFNAYSSSTLPTNASTVFFIRLVLTPEILSNSTRAGIILVVSERMLSEFIFLSSSLESSSSDSTTVCMARFILLRAIRSISLKDITTGDIEDIAFIESIDVADIFTSTPTLSCLGAEIPFEREATPFGVDRF